MAGFNLNDYEPVEDRLARFWKEHPTGRVLTRLLDAPDGSWVVYAEVYRDTDDDRPAATGMAQEVINSSPVNRTSALENGETSAIGRALANLGYAPKGARPSREEMQKGTRRPEPSPAPSTPQPKPEATDTASSGVDDFWSSFSEQVGFPKARILKQVRSHAEGSTIGSLEGLSPDHPAAKAAIEWAEEEHRKALATS